MRRISTIWGESQHVTEYGTGIAFVSTAGHGGFVLDEPHAARVYSLFPGFMTFSGSRCQFEEDEDFAVVVLAFPSLFDDPMIRGAVRTAEHARGSRWASVVEWLATDAAIGVRQRVANFDEAYADFWWAGGSSSPVPGYARGCVSVQFRRPRDLARRALVLSSHPERAFYTDAELEALTATPLPVAPAPAKPSRSPFPSHCFVGSCYDFEPSDADPGL